MAMELFLFWPTFMKLVGEVSMGPFYVEVFSFLLEAIALPMYVYFWKDFKNRWEHWGLSLAVTIGTYLSAFTVTEINAWMNTPNGFNVATYLTTGKVTDVNPFAPVQEQHILSVLPPSTQIIPLTLLCRDILYQIS